MNPFKFECRAVNVEHCCRHRDEEEPPHPQELLECIRSIVEATQEIRFHGKIKTRQNNYQVDYDDFDSSWINALKSQGWIPQDLKKLQIKSKIKPDAVLSKNNLKVCVEIEKANKKTIWFDLMKIFMIVGEGVAEFGLLVVPRNHAHKIAVWDLFKEARYYRWCLEQYAKVNDNLMSKVAIIGYTQKTQVSHKWVSLDNSVMKEIKEKACDYFNQRDN